MKKPMELKPWQCLPIMLCFIIFISQSSPDDLKKPELKPATLNVETMNSNVSARDGIDGNCEQ